MINQAPLPSPANAAARSEDDSIDIIMRSTPRGALTIAGIATAIVLALWFTFYLLVFLPRGAV